MGDEDPQYDSYEESESLGPAILYPIIASVFSAFCIISIAAFLLSSRKCCKQRRYDDPESALLKERLLKEQKRMSGYKFKFPFGERPLFSSVMQQEQNDIAEEVKESYKSISTNVNKPIICCPNKKTSYVYDPKELGSSSKHSLKEAHCKSNQKTPRHGNIEKDSNAKRLNSPYKCTENELIDSLEKKLPRSNKKQKTRSSEKKAKKKFFTESEIENTEDLKSLFFNKWIRHTDSGKPPDLSSELHSYHFKHDSSCDDVESVLTSISRMDSCRMQKLRDSKFYQKLISQMDTISAVDSPFEEDNMEPEIINEIIVTKTGKRQTNQNLSHDEIMQVAIGDGNVAEESNPNDNVLISSKNYNDVESVYTSTNLVGEENKNNIPTAKELTDRKIIQHIIKSNRNATHSRGNLDERSDSLFKIVRPYISGGSLSESKQTPSDLFKSTRDDNELQESDITKSQIIQKIIQVKNRKKSYLEVTHSDSEIESSTKSKFAPHPTLTRPKSLDLKRKNTDLKIEVHFDSTNSKKLPKKSSNESIDEHSSSCSSRSSSITTWQEIDENMKNEQDKSHTHNKSLYKTESQENSFWSRTGISSSHFSTLSTVTSIGDRSNTERQRHRTPKSSRRADNTKASGDYSRSGSHRSRHRSSPHSSYSGSHLNSSFTPDESTHIKSARHSFNSYLSSNVTPKRNKKKNNAEASGIFWKPQQTSSGYS